MKQPPRNRQDRRRNSPGARPGPAARHAGADEDGPLWLWGSHAVAAALDNPRRQVDRLIATENAIRRLGLAADRPELEQVSAGTIDAALPAGAVHQGIAARVQPLDAPALEDVLARAPAAIAVLDQVSDPHNLGAILRSAAAFGVAALVLQTRHAPQVTGTVAKSAAGAAERVDVVRVVNIARSLEAMQAAGYQVVGLAGEGPATLAAAVTGLERAAIVLGAEGAGLRPAVAKACDRLARIPIAPDMESLNVSNAAAIAFYELARLQSAD